MGLFQMGVAQTNAFRFTKNLLAGMVLAMLISVIWQQSAKSVLRISGMLFVAFNLYAIAHYDVKHFAPAIRMFYLTNALLIGMAIPSAAAVWLAAKTYQEGQSRKKTGLVGPVSVRRVEMRLHQNAARTGDDAPGGFARVFALPRARKNQKRSEETVPFQVARPGPNHNLMFCLTKDLQVAEIKCHYCWTGFGRNT